MNKNILKTTLILSILLIGSYLILKNESVDNKDLLSKEDKQSILNQIADSWQVGLEGINKILEQEQLSKNDLAFLYGTKGVAEIYLRKYQDSFSSLNKALKLNLELSKWKQAGRNHLDLADYYISVNDLNKQQHHIKQSISLFRKSNSHKDLLDARMQLAFYQQQTNNPGLAITTYLSIIEQAQKSNDKVGEMLATNNLATVYEAMNDLDKAIELAETAFKMNLQIANPEYINNSLLYLNKLYQRHNKPELAIRSLELSLMNKLETSSMNQLLPLIVEFNKVLVEGYQYQSAENLLLAAIGYAQRSSQDQLLAVLYFQQGLNHLYQEQLESSIQSFVQADKIFSKISYSYRKDLNLAYLSLADQLYSKNLKQMMINESQSTSLTKAVFYLAKAYEHYNLKRLEESQKWLMKSESLLDENKLFEKKVLLLLKTKLIENTAEIDKELDVINDLIKQKSQLKSLEVLDRVIKKLKQP